MNLSLSPTELRHLLDMLYYANWLMSATKTGKDPRLEPYDQLEQKILALAYQSGHFNDLIDYEAAAATYWPLRAFDDAIEAQGFIAEYDNDTFWEELKQRLASRDLGKSMPRHQLARLATDERLRRLWEREEAYGDEFATHGLERLQVIKDDPD